MRPNDRVVDGVIVTELQLYALTKGREHFCKHQLFIPHRSITILLHACLALERAKQFSLKGQQKLWILDVECLLITQ
jgi:hypothetical protein